MQLDPDTVPSTIEQAVRMIVDSVSDEERQLIQRRRPEEFHHGCGTGFRNGWSLWEPETPIKLDAVKTYGIAHADDLSGLIFAWAFALVKEEPFDPLVYCQRFEQHWQKYSGKSALQAGGYELTPEGPKYTGGSL